MIANVQEAKRASYLEVVQHMVKDLHYGTISIVVQDGKVVQIEQNKKIRFNH